MNYGRKVHCSVCGVVFPESELERVSTDKSIVRVCKTDYAPIKARVEREAAANAAVMEEVKARMKER